MLKKILLLFLLSFIIKQNAVLAQSTTRQISEQNHIWFIENGTIKLKKDLLLFHDVQFRRSDFGADAQQILLRIGLLYNFPSKLQAGAGYCFVETYPYGNFPVQNAFPEHRIWEQAQFKMELGKFNVFNRYRLEQRFIGNPTTGQFKPSRFENRMRYMVRINRAIGEKFYANVFDEIFVNFGKNIGRNIFDQNRIAANVGYKLSKHIAVELGYMEQTTQLRSLNAANQNKLEFNHTATLSVVSNF
jgi:hypothetical protein